MKSKLLLSFIIISFLVLPLRVFAQQDVDPAFNPSKLIDDKVFSDTQTFGGAAGIQKFLETKNSILANTTPSFLAQLKEPQISILKQALDDPHPNGDHVRSAAELIWDAAQSSGLNPQVILVTLNKEQSLVTGHLNDSPDQLQKALDHAMGFDCPDATGCGNLFPGFYFQLFGNLDSSGNRYLGAVKSLMKSFSTPNGRGPAVNGTAAHMGDVITLDNTLGGYNGVTPQQTITLSNLATAALYRYTPHIFNGNYNFWKFFQAWFRYPNGSLIKGPDTILYIIQNGTKQQVPAFVAQARNLNLTSVISVSQNELDTYPTDKIYGPADNTIISVDSKLYVFIANIKHPASSFVIGQRGLNPASAIVVTATDAAVFVDGPQLTPADGTVLRGTTDPGIYLVVNGSLQLYTPFTFAQYKASSKVKVIPDTEIASYPKAGFVPPLSGTLIKSASAGTVYLVSEGQRHPLSGELFRNRGFQFKDIAVLSDDQVNALAVGGFAPPKDNTFFKIDGGDLYVYKEGSKHHISAFVAKQKHITADFTFDAALAASWADGIVIAPRDGTILKGDGSAAVYFVTGGQLRPLTFAAFKRRKITVKQISVLSQAEVDAYAKGDVLTK